VLVKLRYVTRRVEPSGKERFYWQRRGHKLVRLPDDQGHRMAMAEQLNAAADAKESTAILRGSIAWTIAKYRESDEYRALKPGSTKYYKRYLRDIEELGPSLPFSSFTRRAVVDFIESYEKPHQRRQASAVLKNLFKLARYYGIVSQSEADGLRLKTSRPRDRIWSDEEIVRWLEDAGSYEHSHMGTAFLLLQYTAQRPVDMLTMAWSNYNGRTIKLRQQKTGTLVEVPCHPVLKAHLESLPRESAMIVTYRGRAVRYLRFNERFARICRRSGIDAQARDLRRTAMVRMAEAGATVPQIASVSGHSIETTQQILETYLPRNRDLAEIAIARLAEYKKPTKSNGV
jgi:integrase